MPEANIVLTGFMGTGKTTIGREVAARLGRRFVDLDDLIVERAGKPIGDVFAQDGEATFRGLEAAICREMALPAGLVIATGGGAALSAENRAALMAGGTVVCLEAGPRVILDRLAGQNDRPLLDAPDRGARVAELLARRAEAYGALPNHLDTGALSVAAAAERIMAIAADLPAGGHRLVVRYAGQGPSDPSGSPACYDILIAEGLLAQAGRRLVAAGLAPGRCALVTNPTVAACHLATLVAALETVGFEPVVCEVPDGEVYKTLDTIGSLYDRLAEARLARGEPVIALGGGVVGDMAGLVAATWLRGVPLVQIPTSLLAMVDSSVGGKVGVDLPQGKNLVGAFKQPALVLIDPRSLATLPAAEYRAGMAEVLKTAIVGDAALFESLAGDETVVPVGTIAATVRVKADIVERDPFEHGDHAWLNLGHTFGHALELVSGFTLRHGEGVALGTIVAAELSAQLGYCDPDLARHVRSATAGLGLDTERAFDVGEVLAAMGTDKKRRGRRLRFVLPRRIGEVFLVEDVPEAAVAAALDKIRKI